MSDPLAFEALLVEVSDTEARHVFGSFDPEDELFARRRTVVKNYTAVPGFDEDRPMAVLAPYLAPVHDR